MSKRDANFGKEYPIISVVIGQENGQNLYQAMNGRTGLTSSIYGSREAARRDLVNIGRYSAEREPSSLHPAQTMLAAHAMAPERGSNQGRNARRVLRAMDRWARPSRMSPAARKRAVQACVHSAIGI